MDGADCGGSPSRLAGGRQSWGTMRTGGRPIYPRVVTTRRLSSRNAPAKRIFTSPRTIASLRGRGVWSCQRLLSRPPSRWRKFLWGIATIEQGIPRQKMQRLKRVSIFRLGKLGFVCRKLLGTGGPQSLKAMEFVRDILNGSADFRYCHQS